MKKYNLILCALGSSMLSPFAFDDVSHAEDRPRAARIDTKQTRESGGQAELGKEASKPAPTTQKANAPAETRVRMGPTTVTVIDDGEAIDDVVSRVRQARIVRLQNPKDAIHPEPVNRLEIRRQKENANDRIDKAEGRGERRDAANDKREERLERIKEKREQRTQVDRPVRGGRGEK